MARGKRSSGKHYTSKGERNCVARKVTNAARRDYMQSSERIYNQYKAHLKLKNVMVTIENPNKNETNKKFIRVNSKDVWGYAKRSN